MTNRLLMLVALVGCGRDAQTPPGAEAAKGGEPTFTTYTPEPGKSDGYTAPALPAELESNVVLLMPEDMLAERVEIDPLAEGMKSIIAEVAGLYARDEIEVHPMALYVAAKPGKGIKTWAVGIDGPLRAADVALIEKKTSTVKFPAVLGPIALSLVYHRTGRDIPGGKAPMPEAWIAAAKGNSLSMPDALLARVWPD